MSDSLPKHLIGPSGLTDEQKAVLREMRPLLATPMYGGQCFGQFTKSYGALLRLANEIGMKLEDCFVYNESLIQRARNGLVYTFLKGDFTHLFFIDADIHYRPESFLEVLLASHYNNAQIVGATYPRKQLNWAAIRAAIQAGKPDAFLAHCGGFNVFCLEHTGKVEVLPLELLKVRYLGTGFLCINRAVFDKLIETFPDMYCRNNMPTGNAAIDEKIYTFFDCKNSPDPERYYRSEDYYFSDICREAGIPTYACPWIPLEHNGWYAYQGCVFCSNGVYIHNLAAEPQK